MTQTRRELLWDMIYDTVDTLKAEGRTMRQRDLEIRVAKNTGLSVSEVPYVIQSAIAENLITRGGLGRWDHLTITKRGLEGGW